jgi:hypothetical protein
MLDHDYRTDDVQQIVDAVKMTKGVAKVELGKPASIEDWTAYSKARTDLEKKLWKALKEDKEE